MIDNSTSMDRSVSLRRTLPYRTMTIVGVILVIGLVIVAPSLSRWFRADRSVDASSIRMGKVTRGDLIRDVSVQSRVVGALSPTLFSTGQGIVSLRTQPGAQVSGGDVLATIESEELESALDQATAQLLSMRAELGRQKIVGRQGQLRAGQQVELLTLRHAAAQRQLERVELMFREGLSHRSDLETAQDDLRIAGMELTQARTELELSGETLRFETATLEQQVRRQESVVAGLQKRVDDLTIRAPFDGTVASVAVADSDVVTANQPVLQVVNLDSLEVELGLPEEYARETGIGTPAVITFGGREYPGRVTAVSPEVVNSQVVARVAFEGEAPSGLRQNQRLSTRLTFESRRDVLKVPRGAFVESEGGRAAYVVEDDMARRRDIRTGASSVAEIEIIEGLNEGETIVVSDTSAFEDASTVMLR